MGRLSLVSPPRAPTPVPSTAAGSTYGDLTRPASRSLRDLTRPASRSLRPLPSALPPNLMYRWFVGLSPDDPVWDPTTFTKNRDRLQNGEVFAKFMTKLLNHPQVKPLLSDEHFSVDGTLIEAWPSHKSFRPKDGSGDEDGGANFHGQQHNHDTHASTSDPDSRLYRKAAGREAKPLLHGPRHDGEPAWACGGRHRHVCHRHCRAPHFGDHAQGQSQEGLAAA